MIKNIIAFTFFIANICINIYAQEPGNILWQNNYGGVEYDEANAVVKTETGDYIIAGYTQSYGLGRWGNAYFIKVDVNGDSVWTRNYGWDGIDVFASLTQSSDGMFVGAGLTDTPENFENIYLVKIDTDGNLQWEKNYGGELKDVALSVINTDDGGMILTGVTRSFSNGEEDLFIFRTDVDGDSLWFKTYGGSGNDGGYNINKTSDGGFILAGLYNWSDLWLVKTDSVGDTLWTKTLGGPLYDEGISVIETDDKGFIICGSTSSFGAGELDAYLIKTDSLGNLEWQNTFGGAGYDEGRKVIKRDDGYFVLGNTDSGTPGEFNYFVIWTDLNGDSLLTKTYGDAGEDRCFDVIDVDDKYFLIAGADFNAQTLSNASLLLIESGNNPSGVEEDGQPEDFFLSNAYPNPFNPVTTIRFHINKSSDVSLKIYDVLGNEVAKLIDEYKSAGDYEVLFNAEGLASGTYFYKLESGSFKETKKIILLK
jgi:hypothetical protein